MLLTLETIVQPYYNSHSTFQQCLDIFTSTLDTTLQIKTIQELIWYDVSVENVQEITELMTGIITLVSMYQPYELEKIIDVIRSTFSTILFILDL